MATYRLYRLDGAGNITSAEWLEADTDDAALAGARLQCSDRFELWQRDRLVGNASDRDGGTPAA